MRTFITLIACCTLAAFLSTALAQDAAPKAAPQTQPSTRPWLSGTSTQPTIIIPATRPVLERPMLSLQYDSNQNLLTITLTNKSTKPVVVDHELIIPLYLTFFNERDVPVRTEAADGPDPEPGDMTKRFVTLEPGQSLDRVVELNRPIPTWVSGSVRTFLNEEQIQVPFGREKFRKFAANSKIKRIQVVYAIMPADRDAILSYATKSVDDLGLFTGAATADIAIPDPTPQP